ncbi:hypothetical protein PHYSODRAFT_246080, partial [Phytophthora sojae]
MHPFPPSKRRHETSCAHETLSALVSKRRKLSAVAFDAAAIESNRCKAPSAEPRSEVAADVPANPLPLAIVAVTPTGPPAGPRAGAKVKKTTVLTVVKTVTTVKTTVTTRVSPRATPSAEEELSREISEHSASLPSGVGAPAASDHQWSASPRTRSGRVVLPEGVNASVTMQVAPLAEFRLSPPASSGDGPFSPRSSQSTETEPSPPVTPARSAPSLDAAYSPATASSQTTTPPWSPQSPFRSRLHKRAEVLPAWYTVAVASDSDEPETAPLIGSPLPAARPSFTASRMNSPGFTVVEGGAVNPPRDEWQLETWPDDVQFTSAQLNPRRWKFPAVSVGV